MNEEEKALADKVSSFFDTYAPTKIKEVNGKWDILLPDNDVTNFESVLLSYKCYAQKFPVFYVEESGALANNIMLWLILATGLSIRVRIDRKYAKVVGIVD